MGHDDACNTGLVLGLGFSSTLETPTKKSTCPKFEQTAMAATSFEPSLTLGLSGDSYQATASKKIDHVNKGGYHHQYHNHEEHAGSAAGNHLYYRQASPYSGVSSFSSGKVKRERNLSSEEVEIEKNSAYRVSSTTAGEDEDGVNARKKLRLTKEQSARLEESFKEHSTLNPVINYPYLIINYLLLF